MAKKPRSINQKDHQHVLAQPRGARVGPLVRQNLVAIGTAAVLTVYSAGYARTRDAAKRFAEADQAARRPIAPVFQVGDSSVSVAEPADAPEARSPAPLKAPSANRTVAVSAPVSRPRSVSAPTPKSTTVDSATATEPQKDSTPKNPTEPAAMPVAQTTDSAGAPPAADSAARQPLLKDGEYYGWGTSRHGDIQAGIEIKGGRITGAWVQQCLTRYSCSWIAALPGQVVARQSAEVDYVSGATQSTNAFYYAVVEALSRAK
jgi:uncharacterized protein with FMN-binding domain